MPHWNNIPLPLSAYDISFIRSQELFWKLEEHQLQSLLVESQTVKLKKGDLLYTKNQSASHFYILATGRIKLALTSHDGKEKVIDIIKPKKMFAATALLAEQQVYSEDAWAISETRIIALRADVFHAYLKESSDLCLAVMENVSQHVKWLTNEIDMIALHDATYRVISYLLEEVRNCDKATKELQLSASGVIIASRLSITPETLSRILKDLSIKNLIEHQKDGTIFLKNTPKLRKLISF